MTSEPETSPKHCWSCEEWEKCHSGCGITKQSRVITSKHAKPENVSQTDNTATA